MIPAEEAPASRLAGSRPGHVQNRRVKRIAAALVLVTLGAIFLTTAAKSVVHHDVWHQMALARETFRLGYVPTWESFAYTAKAVPAIQHEWGAGVIAYLLAETGGGSAVLAFNYLLLLAIACGVYRLAKADRPRHPMLWLGLALTCYLILYSLLPLTAQTYSVLCSIALLWFLRIDRGGGRRWIWAWIPIYLFWLNVHGGVVVGIGMLSAHAVEQALRREKWKHIVVLLAAMVPLMALNPYGLRFYRFLFEALTARRPIITEWSPMWMIEVDGFRAGLFLAILGAFVYTVIRRGWREVPGTLILVLLGLASFRAMKMVPFFALAWIAYVPKPLGRTGLGREIGSAFFEQLRFFGIASTIISVPLAAWLIVEAEPWKLHVPGAPEKRFGYAAYPAGAVKYLESQAFRGNLMTPFAAGAYVSWKLGPGVHVGMDSRYETAYRMGWIERAHDMYFDESGTIWKGVLTEYPTDAVLVDVRQPLANLLEKQGEWTPVYRDKAWRIYARPGLRMPYLDRGEKVIDGTFP